MSKTVQINFDFNNPEIRIPGADFWSCNALHTVMKDLKPNAWFQIHRPEDIKKERSEHVRWLWERHDFPIYVHPRTVNYYSFPKCVELPMRELNELWTYKFPVAYSCTFSYQIAMAIREGYALIDMQDVRLASFRESYLERPNLLLWVGEAHRRGIKVLLNEQLTYPFQYGDVERLADIPGWVPEIVANDLFADYARETREYRSEWRRKQAEYYFGS